MSIFCLQYLNALILSGFIPITKTELVRNHYITFYFMSHKGRRVFVEYDDVEDVLAEGGKFM